MVVGDLPIDLCWWTEIVEVVFVVLIVFLSLNRNRWFWLFADWPIDPFQFEILHQPKVLFKKILCLLPQNIMVPRGFQSRTLPSSLGKSWKTHPKIFTKFQFFRIRSQTNFWKIHPDIRIMDEFSRNWSSSWTGNWNFEKNYGWVFQDSPKRVETYLGINLFNFFLRFVLNECNHMLDLFRDLSIW